MENKKRPYGRRTTDENRQTSPKPRRRYGENKPKDTSEPARKPSYKPKSYGTKAYAAKPAKAAPRKKVTEDDGLVRLNKFIANSGICSRREADTYIETGLVTVNGVRVTELGTKVRTLPRRWAASTASRTSPPCS